MEKPAYSPVTPDVHLPLEEMENIDYVTEVFTLKSFWDNARNTPIAESEAQDKIFDLVREVQRHNVRLQNTAGYNGCEGWGRWGRTDGTNAESSG